VKKRVRKANHCTETRERERKSQENRVKACSKFLISTKFPGYSAGITGSKKVKTKERFLPSDALEGFNLSPLTEENDFAFGFSFGCASRALDY